MKTFEEKMMKEFAPVLTYKSSTTSTLLNFLDMDVKVKSALVTKFTDLATGRVDAYALSEYLDAYRLPPNEWDMALLDLKNSISQEMTILTQVRIRFDAPLEYIGFELPEFNFPRKNITESEVRIGVVQAHRELFSKGTPVWGEVTLRYCRGAIQMVKFSPLQTYAEDASSFKKARVAFTTEEWIDVLLAGLNFNPSTFSSTKSKLCLLQRFMPLVEKRLNMIELTIKGNSKSYCYSLSPQQKLAASFITRANAFYNNSTKTTGFFCNYDAVAFDEVQSLRFEQEDLFSMLKTYLENGQINTGACNATGDAGLVLIGNYYGEENGSLFQGLSKDIQEPAFIDRFSCLIQGSQIERMTENRKYYGAAPSSDYLTTMFHSLRKDFYYRAIVDDLIEIDGDADTRNLEAIKKNCCAMLKLLFPHIKSANDISAEEFEHYCLEPSIVGREGILQELRKIDEQYNCVNVPNFIVKGKKYERVAM